MKLTIELDDSQPASGNAAIALIGRIFGFTAAQAPLGSPTSTGLAPPGGVPIPAPAGPPQGAAPTMAPPPAYAPSAPTPTAPATAPTPGATAGVPPMAAPSTPVAAPAPPSPSSGITLAQFAGQVQAFATAYGAKATKARFGELAAAFQQPGWTSNSTIPADRYAEVLPWFQVAQ